jgi:tetratricopeptide (TPR) repeat protein
MVVLGMTYTKLGEHGRAEEILLRAKKREPFNSLVYIGLGMLEFKLREFDSAYQYFNLAYCIKPSSKQARDGMVASLVNRAIDIYGEGNPEQAEELLLEAGRIDPEAVAVLQNLSLIEKERGNLDKAAAHLEEALRLEPRNSGLLGMLIRVRKDQGRIAGLTELYWHLVEVQPGNAQAFAELGLLLEAQSRTEAAEKAFVKAESLDTEEPYPYLYLARLSRERGESSAAILSHLHSAIGKAVRKSGIIQMQAVGTIQEKEGQLGPEEVDILKRLSSLLEEPRRILKQALSLLAEAHSSREEYEEDLKRLSSWYPHSLELRIAVGQLLEEDCRFEEAQDHWRRILDNFPTAVEAHLGLARSLEYLGKVEEARTAYLRVRDLNPQNRTIYTALLRLYEAGGEELTLMQWYGELYARERTNPVLLESWAELEERLGYPEQAAKHRQRARDLEEERD